MGRALGEQLICIWESLSSMTWTARDKEDMDQVLKSLVNKGK